MRTRKPFSRFRRRSSGLRRPQEPFRWEVGHAHIIQDLVLPQDDVVTLSDLTVTSLAQIPDHVGDEATAQGRTLNNMARFLEIGGIVCHGQVRILPTDDAGGVWPDGAGIGNFIASRVLLVSDRLDNLGQPSAFPNWFTSTNPVVLAGATEAQDEDSTFPTRIHWQTAHWGQFATANDSGIQSTAGLAVQQVTSGRYSFNRRLRLRLDDLSGLFIHFAAQVQNPVASLGDLEIGIRNDMFLTLYYRVRFG